VGREYFLLGFLDFNLVERLLLDFLDRHLGLVEALAQRIGDADLHLALENDVELVAVVPLAEDHISGVDVLVVEAVAHVRHFIVGHRLPLFEEL